MVNSGWEALLYDHISGHLREVAIYIGSYTAHWWSSRINTYCVSHSGTIVYFWVSGEHWSNLIWEHYFWVHPDQILLWVQMYMVHFYCAPFPILSFQIVFDLKLSQPHAIICHSSVFLQKCKVSLIQSHHSHWHSQNVKNENCKFLHLFTAEVDDWWIVLIVALLWTLPLVTTSWG